MRNRFICFILFLASVLPAAALTTITAQKVQSGVAGQLLASGYLCFTPVLNGQPSGFTATGGGQSIPQQSCFAVVNGVAAGVQIYDTSTIEPAGVGYSVQVQNAANVAIYNLPQPIYPTGSTWSLDTWFPTVSAPLSGTIVQFGANPPQGRCSVPSLYYTPTGSWNCIGQVWVAMSGSGGSFTPTGDLGGTSASTVVQGIKGLSVASAPTQFGQTLENNGGQLAPSWGTAALQYPGSVNLGDSITCGYGSSNYSADGTVDNGWAWLIDAELGGSINNLCHSGDALTDTITTKLLPSLNPQYTKQPTATAALATNDYNSFGSGSGAMANYAAAMGTVIVWMTTPAINKVMLQNCTQTGTWTANSLGYDLGVTTTQSGATASCPVNVGPDGVVYVGYRVVDSNSGGSGNISIDGVAHGTITSTGFSGQSITSGHNVGQTVFVDRITGISQGFHTVTFTSTVTGSGVFGPDFIATQYSGPPVIGEPRLFWVGNPYEYQNSNAALSSTYYAAAQATVATYASDGLNVAFVPVRNEINSSTDMQPSTTTCRDGSTVSSGFQSPQHPNDCGYMAMRDVVASVINPFNPPAVGTGSTSSGTSIFTTPVVTNVPTPADITFYSTVNGSQNASTTSLDGGLNVYCSGYSCFGLDLGYSSFAGGFGTRLYAPNLSGHFLGLCFHDLNSGSPSYPTSQSQIQTCPVLVEPPSTNNPNGAIYIGGTQFTGNSASPGAGVSCTGAEVNINSAGLQVCKNGAWVVY